MAPQEESEFDVRHVFTTLRRRAWVVVLCAVLGLVVGLVSSILSTSLYAATAQVRIVDPSAEAMTSGAGTRADRERETATQVEVLKSRQLREAVDERLGGSASEIDGVSIQAVGNSDVIGVRVASSSPEVARDAADAYTELYLEQRRTDIAAVFEDRAARLRESADELQERISEVNIELVSGPSPLDAERLLTERDSLIAQQADLLRQAGELEVQGATRTGNVTIVQTAALPEQPFSPNTSRNLVVFTMLGLIIGFALALVIDRLDDRIRAEGQSDVLGVPVIGLIPSVGKRRGGRTRTGPRKIVEPDTAVAEAFRTLATSVRFSAVGQDLHTVIVTSADRAEGKSTIAANLAVALAEMSQKVILVSADLRAPVQGEIFGLDESSKGLTSVLLGDAPLASCLQVVTLESGRTLYLLPSGPEPANPHVLLSSDQMVALLSSLTETGADFVLIDCPPVLAVGDTLALAHMVDGILVVASAGVTWRKAFAETLERLRKVGGVVDGVVLNRTEAESRYGVRYGEYGYGHRQPKVEAG